MNTIKEFVAVAFFLLLSIASGFLMQVGKGIHMGIYPEEYQINFLCEPVTPPTEGGEDES